ncbi:MAG: MFS transporter, partial [Silvibacterium sp.]
RLTGVSHARSEHTAASEISPRLSILFYAMFCVAEALFVWRPLPETKGRTLEKIGASWTGGA